MATALSKAQEYRESKRDEAEELSGTGETVVKHTSLPLSDVSLMHIDRIFALDSRGRLALLRRGGGREKFDMDDLADILINKPTKKISGDKRTASEVQEEAFGDTCTTAVADMKTMGALRREIESVHSVSDDADERLLATKILRCIEATATLTLSRIMPVVSRYLGYRFWAPEDMGTLIRDWTEHLGMTNSPSSFFDLADMAIAEASSLGVSASKAPLVTSEAHLVWGQQFRSVRTSLSTHSSLENIRAYESFVSAIDPVGVNLAAVAGRAAVIESISNKSDLIVFDYGFRSKVGAKGTIISASGDTSQATLGDPRINDDGNIEASFKLGRSEFVDRTFINTEGGFFVENPRGSFSKSPYSDSAWMTMTQHESWANRATEVRPGRKPIPTHISIAGADLG